MKRIFKSQWIHGFKMNDVDANQMWNNFYCGWKKKKFCCFVVAKVKIKTKFISFFVHKIYETKNRQTTNLLNKDNEYEKHYPI